MRWGIGGEQGCEASDVIDAGYGTDVDFVRKRCQEFGVKGQQV